MLLSVIGSNRSLMRLPPGMLRKLLRGLATAKMRQRLRPVGRHLETFPDGSAPWLLLVKESGSKLSVHPPRPIDGIGEGGEGPARRQRRSEGIASVPPEGLE